MLLHTVNKSPFESNSLKTCLEHAKAGSGVLLIEDGVYGALNGSATEAMVREAMGRVKVFVLGPDLAARGFKADRVVAGVDVVDYGGFVDLVTDHNAVQAWL